MKNFFKEFFNKQKKEEPVEDNSVLLSAISLMIEVSLADEIMDISEIETLKNVLLEKFDVEETDLENLISDAKKNQNSSTSLYEFTRKINDEYEFDDKKNLILSMWKIAYADGELDVDEERLIRRLADLVKIKDIEVLKLKNLSKKDN